MQAYLKSELPCHGVRLPDVRKVTRALWAERFETVEAVERAVRQVWSAARFREERWAALALLRHPGVKRLITERQWPLFEFLISDGAWWDLVDEVATHHLHPLLASAPEPSRTTLRAWSRSQDLWLRRSAIIAQVNAGPATDVELFFELMEPAVTSKEFFLRKGCGWALRSLAKRQPAAVRRWLREHDEGVSGLTRREAERGLAQGRGAIPPPATRGRGSAR